MKKAPNDVDVKLTHDNWLNKGQLSGATLSKKMKDGKQSANIWSSFQTLSLDERTTLLKKSSNAALRQYNELVTLLTPPVSAEKQRRLANLVKKHETFIRDQLEHDPSLRQKYLAALQDSSHIDSSYRILLQHIAKTPSLAKDFQTLLNAYMTNTPCSVPLHILYFKAPLRRFLVSSYTTYPAITNTLLKFPENFDVEFIARIVLSRTTMPRDFIENINTAHWKFWNTLQIILSYVSSTLADFISSSPPIYSVIQEAIIQKDTANKQEAANKHPGPQKSPIDFNAFRTISAAESQKAVAPLAVQLPEYDDVGDDSGLSPIRLNRHNRYNGFYSPYPKFANERDAEEEDLQYYVPPSLT